MYLLFVTSRVLGKGFRLGAYIANDGQMDEVEPNDRRSHHTDKQMQAVKTAVLHRDPSAEFDVLKQVSR